VTVTRVAPLVVTIALAAALPGAAQDASGFEIRKVERLHLDDIETGLDGKRVVELYLRALTRYDDPVDDLRPVDLAIRDNDEVIELDNDDKDAIATVAELGRGMTCVIAIDTSRTMKGEPFDRAKAAALKLLEEHIESRDRVAVVAFSDDARVVVGFDASRAEARVELEALQVDERSLRTVLYDGVHTGIELIRKRQDLPRRSFLIVFSDGKDGGSQRSLEQVIEEAKGSDVHPPTLVFTIGYSRFGAEGMSSLDRLARETQADFLPATSTIHLASFFGGVWNQMQRSFVIRYDGDLDGELHTVEVSVDGQTTRHTTRYKKIAAPIWPYLAVAAGVLLLGALVWLLTRGRSAGRLVFQTGPRAGEVIPLRRGRTRIGAIPENNDIVIPSEAVSRYHAVIYRKRGRLEIEDKGSSNGTFVNGTSVKASPLEPRDRVRLADVEMVYER
jgi:VWFA-related protein